LTPILLHFVDDPKRIELVWLVDIALEQFERQVFLPGFLEEPFRLGSRFLSLFYILFLAQTFFSSAIYSVVGPYMSEIWPARLRSSGMGMSYGVGNLGGKVLGPAGLALIMGAGDIIKPAAPNLVMLGPAFIYFASWLVLGVIGFWAFGPETKGRTFEEMDDAHAATRASARVSRVPASAA
jgi:MFS family permease